MIRRLFTLAAVLSLVLFAIAIVLWARSYGGTPVTPSTARMQASLARRLPGLQFNAVGLVDVLDFLRDVSGVSIDVDRQALATRNIDRNAPISLHLRNVRLGEAIAKVGAAAGPLRFVSEDDVIHISTPDRVAQLRSIRRAPQTGPAGQAMRNPIPLVDLNEVPLSGALTSFGTLAGVQVAPDWPALQESGVTPRTPVTIRMRRIPGDAALSIILRDVRGREDLQFQSRGPAVVVSTQKQLELTDSLSRWPLAASLVISAIVLLAVLVPLVVWWRKKPALPPASRQYPGWAAPTGALLLVAIAAILAWSFNPPVYELVRRDRRFTLGADHAMFRLWSTPADPATPYQDGATPGNAAAPDSEKLFERSGLSLRRGGAPFHSWVFAFPLWELAALAALLPLLWTRSHLRELRRRRQRLGLCRSCGYNLTGNTSGLCPECGTPVAAEPLTTDH